MERSGFVPFLDLGLGLEIRGEIVAGGQGFGVQDGMGLTQDLRLHWVLLSVWV